MRKSHSHVFRPLVGKIYGYENIIAGAALKGPADRLMTELGHRSTVVGVARYYAPFVGTLVIDDADASLADDVRATGVACIVAPTVMHTPEHAAALAKTALGARG